MPEITANGLRFYLVDEGAGTPVVLLHGFPDTSHLWRHQIAALVGAGYRAIAPDLRGRGRSERPAQVEDRVCGYLLGRELSPAKALEERAQKQDENTECKSRRKYDVCQDADVRRGVDVCRLDEKKKDYTRDTRQDYRDAAEAYVVLKKAWYFDVGLFFGSRAILCRGFFWFHIS